MRRREGWGWRKRKKIGFGVSSCNVIYDIDPFGSERIRSKIKTARGTDSTGRSSSRTLKRKVLIVPYDCVRELYMSSRTVRWEKRSVNFRGGWYVSSKEHTWIQCKAVQHMKPKSSEGLEMKYVAMPLLKWWRAKHGNSLSPRWGK